ncbi:MAG: hypothetical protein FWE31_00535 [Firmicutes bacterium]|nr:hypothetical protein [Bacillota bacterium]
MEYNKEKVAAEKYEEKQAVALRDRIRAMKTLAVPSIGTALLEMLTTMEKMSEEVRFPIINTLMDSIPFPILYNLFESAPDPVRQFLAPAIVAGFGIFGGGATAGEGINRLRYLVGGLRLNSEANKLAISSPKHEMQNTYKKKSKCMTAERAYTETREEMFKGD